MIVYQLTIRGAILHRGHFSSIKLPSPDSRTGVDLEVVFLVGLQSTLFEAHTRSLDNERRVP